MLIVPALKKRSSSAIQARLVHVAMDLGRLVAVALQALVEFAHGGLAVAEDDAGPDVLGPRSARAASRFFLVVLSIRYCLIFLLVVAGRATSIALGVR